MQTQIESSGGAETEIQPVKINYMSKQLHDLLMDNRELLATDVRAAISMGIPVTFSLDTSFVANFTSKNCE